MGQQRYHPYGTGRPATGSLPTDYRFTGQRHEGTIGLYDYGARFYDPWLGRFVSADSIVPEPGNPQALNRYTYCSDNPVRYVDPTGHFRLPPWFERLAWQSYQGGCDLVNGVWQFFTGSDAPEPIQHAVGNFFATNLGFDIASPVTVAAAPVKAAPYIDDAVKLLSASSDDAVRLLPASADDAVKLLPAPGEFGNKGSIILTEDNLWKYGTQWGGHKGQAFVTTREAAKTMVYAPNRAEIGRRLGTTFPEGSSLIQVDIDDLAARSVRMPTGGGPLWRPGGITSGGLPERVIDPINLWSFRIHQFWLE